MRKLLVLLDDIETRGAAPGSDTFTPTHETMLREVVGKSMEIVIAIPADSSMHTDAEVVAAFPSRMPALSQVPHAKWMHVFSAGVDKLLTPEVAHSSVMLSNSSGIHATPIAEHIIALCLMFARGFVKTRYAQQKKVWKKENILEEFRDSRVLIVGLGAIGRESARLAHAFGARVSAVSRSGKDKPNFVERLETTSHIDTLLPEADFVVITLPGTRETEHLFDASKLSLMKKSAVLINIGRGSIVDEVALIGALRQGSIAGAGLDVFETEPLPTESPLWEMENVVITPHHSGLSRHYMDRAIALLCENLRAYLAGAKLPTEIDKSLGY